MPKTKLVYIIDDDPIYIYMLDRILKETDFTSAITSFPNGKPALEKLSDPQLKQKDIPEVIFLDLSMPVMNGWEFLEKIAVSDILKNKQVKIVLISSSINPREIELIKSYPLVTKYIVKPITPADLEAI